MNAGMHECENVRIKKIISYLSFGKNESNMHSDGSNPVLFRALFFSHRYFR